MKHIAIFTICFLATAINLSAQRTNVWKGGFPGHENEWSFPRNWSQNQVPNEFDKVIVPDVSTSTFNNPIISDITVEVLSLQILAGGTLVLLKGSRIMAEEFINFGNCTGCDLRIWIEGEAEVDIASH